MSTPGSAQLVPSLCTPTAAPVPAQREGHRDRSDQRATAMPRRRTTRTHNRTAKNAAEKRLNRHHREADQRWQQQLHAITATHDPPPF